MAKSDPSMDKCDRCGTRFDVSDAREEYNEEFGRDSGIDYDDFGGGVCANCAISQSQSEIDLGRAIQMWNGDEDYDADHVGKSL